jgi:protein SCO1/2
MKKIVLMSALLLGTMGAFAQHEHAQTKKEEASKKEEYQCPMKCEGNKTYSKKGKCPACQMELKQVKK